jgi:outer membrane biosynthesis protein TonB
MKTISKLGLGVALLALTAGCGSEAPSHDNHSAANGQDIVDNGMVVDPEIPNAAVQTNVAAAPEPEVEPAASNEPAVVKIAPVPPAAPKAPPKADAQKAKADVPKAAPKAAPKPEASPPAKAECLPEHRAAGHC